MKTRLTFTSLSPVAKWVLYPTGALAGLCFFSFIAISVHQGGDALSGYIREGHHFICSHGNCVEVSAKVWTFSYWHAIANFAGVALVFAEAAVLNTGHIQWE